MPENCNPNDCPVAVRVEKEFDRYRENSSGTHRQMFDRIGALEQNGAAVKTKLDSIEEKLDELTATVKALADKPAKRWESLVGYALSALAGAFLLWVASGMPGVGK
mgnify:CR=1 FL=1